MLEQVFIKLLEGTVLVAIEHVSLWLTDAMLWTTTTGAVSPPDKEHAIHEQSMGYCDHRLTECTLLHGDDQLWFSCTAVNCSDDSWNGKSQCFEANVYKASTKTIQSCGNSTIINRDMEDALKTGAKGISSVYISQGGDHMEMLIENQSACSLSLPISDCTYNQFGKLVRMTIKFDEFDLDASCSSSGNESEPDTESYKSDCEEDFIIFDSGLDACHFTSGCKDLSPRAFDTCSSANSTNTFGKFCREGKANFEQNLAAFVKGIDKCHPFYYHRPGELHFPGNEALKGIKISNNNVPVMLASANELCKGKVKELPGNSHYVNCKAQGVFLDHHERKAEIKKPKKCVQFKQEPELVTMHSIVAWDFAYRQARIGPWERAAVDRLRFQKRIQELENVLGPLLLGRKLNSEQIIFS